MCWCSSQSEQAMYHGCRSGEINRKYESALLGRSMVELEASVLLSLPEVMTAY
jgi:hypothetical protein